VQPGGHLRVEISLDNAGLNEMVDEVAQKIGADPVSNTV
jgi:hypothetical protein